MTGGAGRMLRETQNMVKSLNLKSWNGKAHHELFDHSQEPIIKPAYLGFHSNMANIQISVNKSTYPDRLHVRDLWVCRQLARH